MRMILYFVFLIFLFSCGEENEHQLDDGSLYFDLKELDDDELEEEYARQNAKNG